MTTVTANRAFSISECPECERFASNSARLAWCLNTKKDLDKSNSWRLSYGLWPLSNSSVAVIGKPTTTERGNYFVKGLVGTRLTELIQLADLVLPEQDEAVCQCAKLATMMDAWGITGCELQADFIIKRLNENAAKINLMSKTAAWGKLAIRGVYVNPLNPRKSLLQAAIAMAR